MGDLIVVEFEKKYRRDFDQLNRLWIEKYFKLEPADVYVLENPEENIIQPGGAILIALNDLLAVGTVGLRKLNATTYELIKMAVHENSRGKGIGELLGFAVLEKARLLGAETVILYSNTTLKPALSLYQKLGFVEVPLEADVDYERCDIKMEVHLSQVSLNLHPYKMFL